MDDNDAISQILEVTQGGVDVAIDFVGTSSTAKRLAASLNKVIHNNSITCFLIVYCCNPP